jgi:hypothetical protein
MRATAAAAAAAAVAVYCDSSNGTTPSS